MSEGFFQPEKAAESASLYEHCARALDASLDVGGHGAPLIGGGDWNDGFNRVGHDGKGESVWLGWFLHSALGAFIPIAEARGDDARAAAWTAHAGALRVALHRQAWDGDWYRRGWFDDGTPLGSSASAECRIDSIAQSWAAISGAGDPKRVLRAMAAVERELILPETGIAMLFAPPFDQTPLDPGYIKGYPPGIRENGGQYTHAALWSVIAFTMLGQGDKAASLLAMLNPINHSRTLSEAHQYKLEPYVVAADIYSRHPHVGRGGWSWYTGAAGWMHRAGVEYVLGLRIEGDFLLLDPCIPAHWPRYELTLKRDSSCYEIIVENPAASQYGVADAEYDGVTVDERPLRLPLRPDGKTHSVKIVLGAPAPPAVKTAV
jgi:cyclic beta-1,2-glucan synthetase